MSLQFLSVFAKMFVLFLLLIAGYLGGKFGVLDQGANRNLSQLVLNITLPCTMIASALTTENLPGAREMLLCLGVSVLCYVISYAIAAVPVFLFHLAPEAPGTALSLLALGNTGFVGIPMAQALFGNEAVMYATLHNSLFNFLVLVLTNYLVARDAARSRHTGTQVRMDWRAMIQPCTVACVVAAVISLARFRMTGPLPEALTLLGNMTSPASLLVVGSSMSYLTWKELAGSPRTALFSALRLLVIPLAAYVCFAPWLTDQLLMQVTITELAMPSASMTLIYAIQYRADVKLATQMMFWTNLCCMITIPALIALFLT